MSEGRLFIFYSLLFFPKHLIMHRCGECISHWCFYCDGWYAFKEPAPCGYFCSNPLFVCQINFHSGPESGRASKRKGGSCDCAQKTPRAPAYQIIAISRAKNHLAGCNGLMNHATFSHRDLLCSTGREKKSRDKLSLHCLAARLTCDKKSHFHLCMKINSLFGISSFQSGQTSKCLSR